MKKEIVLEICMDLNRGRISAEGATDLIMLQNTSSNSDYAKCKNQDHDLKESWEYRQCSKCGEYVAVG